MGLLMMDVRGAFLEARQAQRESAFAAELCGGFGPGAEPPTPGEVAERLRAIARLLNRVSAADLALDDGEVRDALAEVAYSYGFARLSSAAHEIRLAELHADSDQP